MIIPNLSNSNERPWTEIHFPNVSVTPTYQNELDNFVLKKLNLTINVHCFDVILGYAPLVLKVVSLN